MAYGCRERKFGRQEKGGPLVLVKSGASGRYVRFFLYRLTIDRRAVTGREYPFIHFISVVLIPNLYWIAVIEAAMIVSHADNEASPSTYGQVGTLESFRRQLSSNDYRFQILSVFVAVPSMVSTLTLYPKFLSWFFHLTWVRRVPFLRELGQKWEEKRRQNGNASAKGSFQGSITGVVEEYDMSRFSSSQLDLKTERSNLVTIGH